MQQHHTGGCLCSWVFVLIAVYCTGDLKGSCLLSYHLMAFCGCLCQKECCRPPARSSRQTGCIVSCVTEGERTIILLHSFSERLCLIKELCGMSCIANHPPRYCHYMLHLNVVWYSIVQPSEPLLKIWVIVYVHVCTCVCARVRSQSGC